MQQALIFKTFGMLATLTAEIIEAKRADSDGGKKITKQEALQIGERVLAAAGLKIDLDGDGVKGE